MIEETVAYIQSKIGILKPDIGLILGSGLAEVAGSITNPIVIPYKDIPDFPQSSVAGHKSQLTIGQIGQHTIVCLQGRFHLYEGHPPQVINTVIMVLKKLGIKELIVTNASGSLNPDFAPGSIMIIADHINFSGLNPLIGVNDDQYGPRFPSLTYAYSVDLRKKMKRIALESGIQIHEGIYLMVLGPNFETPAEIRTFHAIGADAVGMSTVPEVICAVRCGMKVLGLSVITNYGAGMVQNATSHDETLEQGNKACTQLSYLIQKYLEDTIDG